MALSIGHIALAGVFLLYGLACPAYALAEDSAELSATIKTTRESNGSITIQPVCRSSKSLSVVYSLSVFKFGKGGQSISRQSAKTMLRPDLPVTLCKVSLSLPPESKCRILLKIIHHDQVILQKDRWLSNPDKHGSI